MWKSFRKLRDYNIKSAVILIGILLAQRRSPNNYPDIIHIDLILIISL